MPLDHVGPPETGSESDVRKAQEDHRRGPSAKDVYELGYFGPIEEAEGHELLGARRLADRRRRGPDQRSGHLFASRPLTMRR
jgi:hypothetical protein